MALYLEKYLDSIENLPFELQRNFALMRDLDQRAQDLLKEIDRMADEYLRMVQGIPRDKRKERFTKIQNAFSKSREFSDDKVQLAMQTYEMVDKHIRKLDADLARFEQELKERNLEHTTSSPDAENTGGRLADGKKRKKGDKGSAKKGQGRNKFDEQTPKLQSRKKQKTTPGQGIELVVSTPLLSLPAVINQSSDVLDMPVDPNEPTYCLCHQVSYGEMIGCDNPDCPIEWFHFGCVGLINKPKGKWYCPKCIQDKKTAKK